MYEGEAYTIQISYEFIYSNDLRGKAKGTDKSIKITFIYGKALIDADIIHAHGCNGDAQALQ